MDQVAPTTNAAIPAIGIAIPTPPPPGPITLPGVDWFPKTQRTAFDEDRFDPFSPSFDVDGGAARAVAAYDRDGDGAIDLNSFRCFGTSETTRIDKSGTHSIAKLAREADRRGNGDGKATAEEIAAVIDDFDGRRGMLGGSFPFGGDGRLDSAERRRFLDTWGESDVRARDIGDLILRRTPIEHIPLADVAMPASEATSAAEDPAPS